MSKKVRELKEELLRKERENFRLASRIDLLEHKFEVIQKMLDSTPEDCTAGKYCQACAFSMAYGMRVDGVFETIYLCNKNSACKNFVQKPEEE